MLLSQREIREERLAALAAVFERADRVLTNKNVTCEVVKDNAMPAPAWSDGIAISFNDPLIGDVTSVDDIIKVTGLNYHELSHVLFTPRNNTELGLAVVNEGLQDAFNILEDQRIETLLTGWYPATEPYFLMIIMQYILDTQSKWEVNYMLCAGRKYLPQDVVAELRKRYKHQDDLADIDRIIGEYRLLAYPVDSDYMLELIREFKELLDKHIDKVEDPFGHASGVRPEISHGKPLGTDDQQDAAECAEIGDEEREADKDGEGKGKAKGKGKRGKNKDESSSGESDDESDDEDAGGDSAGLGSKKAPGKSLTDSELKKRMKEAKDKAKKSPDVQRDTKRKQEVIVKDLGGDRLVPRLARPVPLKQSVDAIIQNASRKAALELETVRTDLDPGWMQHKPSGRLNVARVMRGSEPEEAFDQWNEGVNDASDFEWVICIDLSGSMRRSIYDVSMALWATKRAIESIGGSVTVFGFNDQSTMLYDKHEKAEATHAAVFDAGGGTDPGAAISAAARVFYHSKRKHKVFAIFSDGDWTGSVNASERRIKAMSDSGIVTVSGFFDNGYSFVSQDEAFMRSKHQCMIHLRIERPEQVIQMCKQITRSMMH